MKESSFPSPNGASQDLVPVSRLRRFLNALIDTACILLLLEGLARLLPLGDSGNGFFLIPLTFLAYYLLFEYFLGKTPAKFFTRTRVVSADGKKPAFSQVLSRTIFRCVPLEPLSFFLPSGIGWHDRASRTRVVEEMVEAQA